MKSLLVTFFIQFFITFSLTTFAQTYKIDSVIKGLDLKDYSRSSQNYFEGLTETISEFNLSIKEGQITIVSMEKSDWKLLFRFYRAANMMTMPRDEYLKVNEFYSNSDLINGINYIEMSVERVSEVISSGEIRFYPEKGLYKPIFMVDFSCLDVINNSGNLNNVLDSFDVNNKQRIKEEEEKERLEYEALKKKKEEEQKRISHLNELTNKIYNLNEDYPIMYERIYRGQYIITYL